MSMSAPSSIDRYPRAYGKLGEFVGGDAEFDVAERLRLAGVLVSELSILLDG